MSKRLRASMRAANKGRNLRPRASLPPQERASGAPPPGDLDSLAPDAADDLRDEGPETEDSSQAEMQGDAGAFKAPDETSSASTLRPEQIEARAAEAEAKLEAEAQAREEAEQAAAKAQQEAAARREAEAEAQRRAEARLMAEAKAQREADAKAKQEAEAKAQRDAEAKAKAQREAEAKAKAQREADAKAKQDAEAKARAQREAEAKAKAAKDAPLAKKGAVAKPDEKKGAKAEQAPASVKKPIAMGDTPKPQAAIGESPKAQARPAARLKDEGHLDDETDASSVSAEFFRKDEDSVPPVEEVDEASHQLMVLSPTTLARRARLRRLVAGVVAFAGVISIAVVGKTLAAPKRTTAPTTMVDSKREAPKTPQTTAPTSNPAPVAEAPKVEPAKVEPAKVEEKKADEPAKVEPAKVEEKKADEKKADEPAKAAPSGGDAVALTKETESLLNRGKRKEAIDKAREAIAADPNAAMPYLLLGSALQDSGKWKDGIEAYSECVRHATKGPVHECRAMGGRK